MALKWYELRSADGRTIEIKGRFEAEAKREAAERWDCACEDVVCTGHKPFNTRLTQIQQ